MDDSRSRALDRDVLATLRQLNEPGEPDVVKEVLALFVADAPRRMEAIVAAVVAHDAAALQRAAHTMKGASGTIGATALQGECRALEEFGKQQNFAAASARLEALEHEYRRVQADIAQLL